MQGYILTHFRPKRENLSQLWVVSIGDLDSESTIPYFGDKTWGKLQYAGCSFCDAMALPFTKYTSHMVQTCIKKKQLQILPYHHAQNYTDPINQVVV